MPVQVGLQLLVGMQQNPFASVGVYNIHGAPTS